MNGRGFLLASNNIIAPFGDPVGDTLICDRPLHDVQYNIFRDAGWPVPQRAAVEAEIGAAPQSALVMRDDLFTTARLVREFCERATALAGNIPVQLWLKKGLFTRLLAVLQDPDPEPAEVPMPLWYLPAGATFATAAAQRLVIDVDEDSYEGNFPPHMIKKEGYRFCLTSRPALAISEPLHLALANMAANFARLAELKKMSAWQKLGVLLRARSLNKFRLLAATSQIHAEAEVHPTAVIEGSVIEKGAKIGAYAVVRFSHVGEKAFVDDHAGVKFSVVGAGAYVANNCVLFFSVAYPRAFLISGPYQFTLFGYDTAMMNSIPADYRLDAEPISIRTRRGVLSTGLRFVGSVIGHRTKIAAGCIIAPGRMIPNDLQILPDPARVINRVADHLPTNTPLFLVSGRLLTQDQLPSTRGDKP